MSRGAWKHGKRRLMPGVYDSRQEPGTMHIDLEELLRAHGYAPNEKNLAVARKAFEEFFPGGKYEDVEDPQ